MRCVYHPAIEMMRVKAPKFKTGWKKKNHDKAFRCPVSGCPYVATIPKAEPPVKHPSEKFPKVVKAGGWNPRYW